MTTINLPSPQIKPYPNGSSNMYQAGNEISKTNNEQLNNLTKIGGKRKQKRKSIKKNMKKQKGGQNNTLAISPLNAKFPEQSTGNQTINGNNQAINELYAKAQVNATHDNCANGSCSTKIGGKRLTKKSKSNSKSKSKSKTKSKTKSKSKKFLKYKNFNLFIKQKSKQLGFIL